MDELLEILNELNDEVDYETEDQLIDGKIYNSFLIITLIDEISDKFDIDIGPEYLVPENFNSAKAMWDLICRLQEED